MVLAASVACSRAETGAICGAVERRERVAKKALARDAGEQRLAQRGKLGKAGQERVIGVLHLAEAESGIEDDASGCNTCCDRRFQLLRELALHQRQNLLRREPRQRLPFLRAAARVHQDDAALKLGAGGGHGVIPQQTAYVVDDLGAGRDGCSGGWGAVGVDRKKRIGPGLTDGFDYGHDTINLLLRRYRSACTSTCTRTGRFAADVDDRGTVGEHRERRVDGFIHGVQQSAVGKGIGCHVQNAHHARGSAQRERARAQLPVEMGASVHLGSG